MKKKIPMIAFALLMSTVFISACSRNVNQPDGQCKTTLQELTVKSETTVHESITENKTEKETTTEPKCIVIETKTELLTDVVSDPTKPATEADTRSSANFLGEPEQILFYHNGKPQTIPKGDVMCDEVIKEINKAIKNDSWGILKLAVEEGYIDKIKSENLCIEIYYDETQTLSGLNGHTQDKYNFEKVLIILDGSDKNTMFFSKDGKYQHGPVGAYSSDLSAEVLKDIFD